MLALHGLVIIAEEIQQELTYPYTSILKFEVASDDGAGKTSRHYIDLYVPKDKLAEAKDRIKVGSVCEIVHGTWAEVAGKQVENNPRRYSKVELKIKWENFKVLAPCVYYDKISGITE
jgi:hypothetical protein